MMCFTSPWTLLKPLREHLLHQNEPSRKGEKAGVGGGALGPDTTGAATRDCTARQRYAHVREGHCSQSGLSGGLGQTWTVAPARAVAVAGQQARAGLRRTVSERNNAGERQATPGNDKNRHRLAPSGLAAAGRARKSTRTGTNTRRPAPRLLPKPADRMIETPSPLRRRIQTVYKRPWSGGKLAPSRPAQNFTFLESKSDQRRFRALAATLNCLAGGRPDLLFASTCIWQEYGTAPQ